MRPAQRPEKRPGGTTPVSRAGSRGHGGDRVVSADRRGRRYPYEPWPRRSEPSDTASRWHLPSTRRRPSVQHSGPAGAQPSQGALRPRRTSDGGRASGGRSRGRRRPDGGTAPCTADARPAAKRRQAESAAAHLPHRGDGRRSSLSAASWRSAWRATGRRLRSTSSPAAAGLQRRGRHRRIRRQGEHLQKGEATKYDTSPPTHGKHAAATLGRRRVRRAAERGPERGRQHLPIRPLARARRDHRLARQAQGGRARRSSRSATGDERKVLLVPYPQLKGDTNVAVTAWGRLAECERPSTGYIDAFIERYRESKDAPEPNAALS